MITINLILSHLCIFVNTNIIVSLSYGPKTILDDIDKEDIYDILLSISGSIPEAILKVLVFLYVDT